MMVTKNRGREAFVAWSCGSLAARHDLDRDRPDDHRCAQGRRRRGLDLGRCAEQVTLDGNLDQAGPSGLSAYHLTCRSAYDLMCRSVLGELSPYSP